MTGDKIVSYKADKIPKRCWLTQRRQSPTTPIKLIDKNKCIRQVRLGNCIEICRDDRAVERKYEEMTDEERAVVNEQINTANLMSRHNRFHR